MSTVASHIEREAGRIAAGLPYHVESARSGNLRPSLNEAVKRLREAEAERDAARWDLDGFLIDHFLSTGLDADREAEVLAEIERLEELIVTCERTAARLRPVVTHFQDRV